MSFITLAHVKEGLAELSILGEKGSIFVRAGLPLSSSHL